MKHEHGTENLDLQTIGEDGAAGRVWQETGAGGRIGFPFSAGGEVQDKIR